MQPPLTRTAFSQMSVNPQPGVQQAAPLNPLQQQQYQQFHSQQVLIDQMKLQDMIDAVALVATIRTSMNAILDNVARANPANNYAALLSGVARPETTELEKASSLAATPSSASLQQQAEQEGSETTGVQEEAARRLSPEQQEFFERTDGKGLQEKALGLGKSMAELERILSKLKPVVAVAEAPEFVAVLNEQAEQAGLGGARLMNNYRWVTMVQELINSTALPAYKRYGQAYSASKVSGAGKWRGGRWLTVWFL
jgi:hypothetical protein